jgi:trans-aconitate 2-methyltransferase
VSDAAAREAEAFYQSFSLAVGSTDWRSPNPRHEQLRALVADVLDGARQLRILDVGCGAGVMSAHLLRWGSVTGTDFSRPAIDLAARMAPDATFLAGRLEDLPLDGPFDVIAAFDVLEHVPSDGLPSFLAQLTALLAPGGRLIASTPHPRHTRWVREHRPELLQVIDEEVELEHLLSVMHGLGSELARYECFDVDTRRQYQFMVFEPIAEAGAGAPMRRPRLVRRLRLVHNRPARMALRAARALRLWRSGDRTAARWMITGS